MARFLPYLTVLGAAVVSGSVVGQTDQDIETTPAKKTERIEVTGSRIKQIDTEGPQPMITLSADDLSRTGATSINEALNTLTIASFGSSNYGSGYGVGEDVQSLSIHGLGSANTLVLINGKRLARDPYLEINDMSFIPIAAVERVEILKGTASAVYGSDALGGVVNIITRRNFDGMAFGYGRTQTRFGGGNQDRAFVMSGTSSENSRNLTVVQYTSTSKTLYDDRPWIDDNWRSTYGLTPSYLAKTEDGNAFRVAADNCAGSDEGIYLSGADSYCRFNHLPYLERKGKRDKLSIFNDYTYDFSPRTSTSVRLFANRDSVTSQGSPFAEDFKIKADQLPQGLALQPVVDDDGKATVRARLIQGGKSVTTVDTLTLSAEVGLSHDFQNGMSLNFSVGDSRVNRDTVWGNRYSKSLLQNALDRGEVNLFAESPQDLSKYKTDAPSLNSSFVRTAELVLSGTAPFFDYAVGTAVFEEGYRNQVARQQGNEEVFGLGGGSGSGERTNRALFAEANIPIGQTLEAKLAARYDDYSDFGNSFNPSVGLLYKPTSDILVAGYYGQGFKAPSLRNIYDSEARYYTTVQDVMQCNEARAADNAVNIERYCTGEVSVSTLSGGNPDLSPETSVTASLGIGYEPFQGNGLKVEYYSSIINDQIDNPDADEMARYEAAGRELPPGVEIIRNPQTGDMERIILPVTNLAAVRTQGVDASIYLRDNYSFGELGLKSSYTRVLSYKNKRSPESDYVEEVGKFGNPLWRWNNTVSYGISRHTTSLTNQAISGYEKNIAESGDVGSFNQWNFNYSYEGSWGGTIEFGGRNIFGQVYPLDDTAGLSQGINDSLYAVSGPTIYTRYTQTL